MKRLLVVSCFILGFGFMPTPSSAAPSRAPAPFAEPAGGHPIPDATWDTTISHMHPYLVCLRSHESGAGGWPYNLGYRYPPHAGHSAAGAYQYLPRTWVSASRAEGFPLLSGTPVYLVSHEMQDHVTLLYALDTRGSPWNHPDCLKYLH